MTDLVRTLKRITAAKVRGNALVVELSPFSITIREYGQRGYELPWTDIYELAKSRAEDRQKKVARKKKYAGA
jgi:predicted ATPase